MSSTQEYDEASIRICWDFAKEFFSDFDIFSIMKILKKLSLEDMKTKKEENS